MANFHGNTWQHIKLEGALFSVDLLKQISEDKADHQKDKAYHLDGGLSVADAIGSAYQRALRMKDIFKERMANPSYDGQKATLDFVLGIFRSCLDWYDIETVRSENGYPIQRKAYQSIPLATEQYDIGLDQHGEGLFHHRSLFRMMQEYLNEAGKEEWGVISNGYSIRLLRSSPTLTRPQFLEFDLFLLLDEDNYAEFSLLWKILHASRFWDKETNTRMTIWEDWHSAVITGGQRVRDGLRVGVHQALELWGNGFLKEPGNEELREAFHTGRLDYPTYYHELLRLAYRFLFLLVTEERTAGKGIRLLLLQDEGLDKERTLYEDGYSLFRLRPLLSSNEEHNSFTDLWETQKVVFRALERGDRRLALPALGGLFSSEFCKDVMHAQLSNEVFLGALENLRWMSDKNIVSWIDYKNMGTEELGSVYESLLELVPSGDIASASFHFLSVEDEESDAGNARKTTGSYYTPHFLVEQLLSTALQPEVDKRLNTAASNQEKEQALLSLRVIDPACGSGHFLLSAAQTIAVQLSHLRSEGDSPDGYRNALREVIRHCIYGVDLNPMAVELTKISLWLESYEPGKPLGFLDNHIRVGNSLLGVFEPSILADGIPNDAYTCCTGDDKTFCAELKKQNTKERKGQKTQTDLENQPSLFDLEEQPVSDEELESLPEDTLEEIAAKREKFTAIERQGKESDDAKASDVYIGTFLLTKQPGKPIPTTLTLQRLRLHRPYEGNDEQAIAQAQAIAKQFHAFHWKLEFPAIFSHGGFDVVLGNPPWDRIKLQEKEFFASRDPKIANAQNASIRKKMIEALHDPENRADFLLYQEYQTVLHIAECQSTFVHVGREDHGQYPLSGVGDTNLYAVFTELFTKLKKPEGRVGAVVPSGISTDNNTQMLFSSFIEQEKLVSLYDFENQDIFPAVHNSYKFCLLTLGPSTKADFACFLHSIGDLDEEQRHFQLSREEFDLINPNTHTLAMFRSKEDARIVMKMYRNSQVLVREKNAWHEEENPWEVSFQRMFDMSNDSNLFKTTKTNDCYPLYEAKMINQYDHRWASYDGAVDKKGNPVAVNVPTEKKQNPTYEVNPQYWIEKREVWYKLANVSTDIKKAWYTKDIATLRGLLGASSEQELSTITQDGNVMGEMDQIMEKRSPHCLMGWRDICSTTNTRTTISSIIPLSGVNNHLFLLNSSNEGFLLMGNFNSLPFDYVMRNKMGGTDLNYFYMKQLCVITPSKFSNKQMQWVKFIVLKLVATSQWIADALGCPVHPFDPEERAYLRAELDAFYARKYGLERRELEYILDPEDVMGKGWPSVTFPGLRDSEIKAYGEYRTKRLTLEAWDRQEREEGPWNT